FGPSIAYVIGSQSTDDPNSGSTYDLPITAAFPKCYYSKYTWNSAAPEFDGTLSSYTPPTATDSSKRYTYKWHSDSATATDNRLNLWKITNPKNVITTMTYNVPPAANTSNKIEVGDSVYVKVTKLEFPVIDGTFTVGSDGRISMKASWGSTYTPYVKDLTTDQAATAIVNAINYPIQRLIPGNYTITVKLTKFVPQAGTHNCLLTSTTDAMNHRTTYEYNGCNELWKTYTDPSGLNLVTVTTYDGYGNVCSTTDPYGKQTTIDYDTTYHCFPIKQTEAATNLFTESGGYDMFGNAGWSNAPRTSSGSVLQTTYTYDKAGQLTKLTNPDTTTVQYTYDTNGNNLTVTDPNGKVATYHYDNFGHINWDKANARVGTIDKDVTTSYCFDELGRHKWTKTVRAGASKQITSYYDERSRLIKETLPGSKPELYKYTYDGTGNILAKKSGHSTIIDQTLSFEYDELGRALKDKCGATILADRTYTADGLLSKIANATGENVEYTYDNAHRELTCYQAYPNKTVECVYMRPPTKTVTVKIYNGRGNTGSLLGTYTHEYDSDWRPTALTSPADVTNSKTIKTTYSYDSAYGLLSKVVYNTNAAPSSTSPGCPYTSLSYDTTTHKRLWLTTVGNYHSDGSKISTFAYLYDNAGNRTTMTEADGACTNYAYDNSYNLLSEERKTSSSGSQVYKYDYQYDEAGNRTVKVLTNSLGTKNYNYTYSDNNILTAITGAATGTFSYDYQGNQVERNITSAGGSHWYYAYDPDNHLTSIGTSSGGTQIGTFRYDVLGRRVGRTDKGRKFVYYGNSLIAETNATMNSIVAWYTPGICESRLEGTSWNTYYYHCDAEGTTREVTDSLQRITDAYAYNAWGEDLGQLRPSTDPAKPTNPLRYVGKSGYYTDTDTGLMLLGARYYDPLIGRFITQDPDKDGLNWYEYADNNPVMNIDPTGTVSLSAAAHGVLGVAGFIPVIGTVTDILDAGVYAIEGDYTSAGVALVACVPIVGDGVKVAATAGKALKFAAKHGDEIAKAGAKIAKAGKAANVADRMKLAMGLALKEATESPGLIMAKGHSIHDIARLLKRGGKADDWAKMTAPAHKLPNGTKIQYHWYENLNTGKRYDMKMKDVTPKFPKTR
ncbi:MAG: hypothetical protein NT018_11930, partial [Armatimonadetes bacterium]|nr:hypothetical protein [Armatimonadota bacterium]